MVFTAYNTEDGDKLASITPSGARVASNYFGPLWPMASDDDRFIITIPIQPNVTRRRLNLYSAGLTLLYRIANEPANSDFDEIGSKPGISDDGKVIVFYGNLTASGAQRLTNIGVGVNLMVRQRNGTFLPASGPGIFASIDDDTSPRKIVRIAGIDGELGRRSNGQKLKFGSYESETRVSVIHQARGAVGIDDDVIVVCFMATPNGTGQYNPNASKGIWTKRVDVKYRLQDTDGERVEFKREYRIGKAVPVMQLGDLYHGASVTELDIYDAIAEAATQEFSSIPRPVIGKGDHRIAFWAKFLSSQETIFRASYLDTDEDGLPDHWEEEGGGLDINQDGTPELDLYNMGASPIHKDIFVEYDYMDGVDHYRYANSEFSAKNHQCFSSSPAQ